MLKIIVISTWKQRRRWRNQGPWTWKLWGRTTCCQWRANPCHLGAESTAWHLIWIHRATNWISWRLKEHQQWPQPEGPPTWIPSPSSSSSLTQLQATPQWLVTQHTQLNLDNSLTHSFCVFIRKLGVWDVERERGRVRGKRKKKGNFVTALSGQNEFV